MHSGNSGLNGSKLAVLSKGLCQLILSIWSSVIFAACFRGFKGKAAAGCSIDG